MPPYVLGQRRGEEADLRELADDARSISSARSQSRACGAISRSAELACGRRISSCSGVSEKSIAPYPKARAAARRAADADLTRAAGRVQSAGGTTAEIRSIGTFPQHR